MNTDIFKNCDIRKLLQGKHVAFLGDSNIRAVYKDFIVLLQKNRLISDSELKTKMEQSFLGDSLTYSGVKYNGRDFRENRFYVCKEINTSLSFFYLTRIYDDYVKRIFNVDVARHPPDILFVNSCLWDITRWGPSGVQQYKKNLVLFAQLLKERLQENCLIVWVTTPPISQTVKGGFLIPQLEFLQFSLRFHVAEANHYAYKVFNNAGFDVVDIHYCLTKFLRWRVKDGIHWFAPVVRFITNHLLTHVSLAWDVELPHRIDEILACLAPLDDTVFAQKLVECCNLEDTVVEPLPMVLSTPSPPREDSHRTENEETPTKDERPIELPKTSVSVVNSLTKRPATAIDSQPKRIRENVENTKPNDVPAPQAARSSTFNYDPKGKALFSLSQNTQNKQPKKKKYNKRYKRNQNQNTEMPVWSNGSSPFSLNPKVTHSSFNAQCSQNGAHNFAQPMHSSMYVGQNSVYGTNQHADYSNAGVYRERQYRFDSPPSEMRYLDKVPLLPTQPGGISRFAFDVGINNNGVNRPQNPNQMYVDPQQQVNWW